jgi:hypothetical protein
MAFIARPDVARRILDHLGLASQGPPVAHARGPGDSDLAVDPAPDDPRVDPIHDE